MPSDEDVRACACACMCPGECACEWSCSCAAVSGEWVVARLRESRALVLDLRGALEFAAGHVRHAVHLSVPAIMLRRLAAGKLPLPATVPAHCGELRNRLQHAALFVLYGEPADPLLRRVLLKRLKRDGATVVRLQGKTSPINICHCEIFTHGKFGVRTPLPLPTRHRRRLL